jgi:CelD/BcsL family acetyltransferase involved in cellulose biosynthesis
MTLFGKRGTSTQSTSILVNTDCGGVEVIERWADAWRILCDESVDNQPFYRPEWIAAHIRAFTPKASVLLLTVTVQGRLCLVLPLLQERTLFCGLPLRRLRAPVNSHSCRFDAVRCAGAEGDLAVRALWEQMKQLTTWDFLEFSSVPKDGTLAALVAEAEGDNYRTAQVPMLPNPYVPIPMDPLALEKLPINKRLRTQLRSIHRELNGQRLNLQRYSEANPSVLQRFYELESAGWKGTEGSAIVSESQTRRFYDEIAKTAESFGFLCLYTLDLDGELLAAHFGLSYKGRYFSPKVAYNESLKQLAPGHLIVEEILRECARRNVHEYDITGPNDEWKLKWTAQTRPHTIHFVFRRGFPGNLAHSVRFRLQPWIKKMLQKGTESAKKTESATKSETRINP